MYNPSIIWYNKKEVLNIFPITERTYFRKIKNISSPIRTKSMMNPQGKSSTLIYYKDIDSVFGKYRRPGKKLNLYSKRKYVGTSKWDIIGNMVPVNGTIESLKQSMRFIKSFIESRTKIKTKDWFFYSIERNPKDNFYHSHFLIKTDLHVSQIEKICELICETDYGGSNRLWVRKYDFNTYQYSGSFYSFKLGVNDKNEGSVFNELL